MPADQDLRRRKVWFRTPPHNPIQDSSNGLRLRIPGQAFPRVGHSLLSQLLEPIPIVREFRQNLFHLRHDVALIRKRHLVPHLWMNDISGPAEVRDHRYGATGESFENHACTVVANGWKHKHIRRSQAPEDFRMAEPAAEGNSLLDPKGFHKLLKAVPLRAIADHGKAGQIVSQKRSSRAQSEITGLPGNQARQRKSAQVWRRAPDCAGHRNTEERPMPGSGTKNSLSRYAANSAYVWDEAAMIAAAWR